MLYLTQTGWANAMTKKDAIDIFKTATALAEACGVSKSAVSQWPDVLTDRLANEVVGAAIRTGRIQPKMAPALLGLSESAA